MNNLNQNHKSRWRGELDLLMTYRTYLTRNPMARIEDLILFVGYPRSNHSMVGALLDAHPQMMIAHQTRILGYLEMGLAKERALQLLIDDNSRFNRAGRQSSGYDYEVKGQWHGKVKNQKFIGDKSGGITARKLFERGNCDKLDEVFDKTNLRPTFIHVIRNPFDTITTMTKKSAAKQNIPVTEAGMLYKAGQFFDCAEGVRLLKAHGRYPVLDVYSEQLCRSTTAVLTGICEQLGVSAPTDYLEACDDLVWDEPKLSRNTLPFWTEENKAMVMKRMKAFPWFSTYSFESVS